MNMRVWLWLVALSGVLGGLERMERVRWGESALEEEWSLWFSQPWPTAVWVDGCSYVVPVTQQAVDMRGGCMLDVPLSRVVRVTMDVMGVEGLVFAMNGMEGSRVAGGLRVSSESQELFLWDPHNQLKTVTYELECMDQSWVIRQGSQWIDVRFDGPMTVVSLRGQWTLFRLSWDNASECSGAVCWQWVMDAARCPLVNLRTDTPYETARWQQTPLTLTLSVSFVDMARCRVREAITWQSWNGVVKLWPSELSYRYEVESPPNQVWGKRQRLPPARLTTVPV